MPERRGSGFKQKIVSDNGKDKKRKVHIPPIKAVEIGEGDMDIAEIYICLLRDKSASRNDDRGQSKEKWIPPNAWIDGDKEWQPEELPNDRDLPTSSGMTREPERLRGSRDCQRL